MSDNVAVRSTEPDQDGAYLRVAPRGAVRGKVNGLTAVNAATSGGGHAVRAVSRNPDAPAVLVKAAGAPVRMTNSLNVVLVGVDASGNTTVKGNLTVGGNVTAATVSDVVNSLLALTATQVVMSSIVVGDSQYRYTVDGSGKTTWGPGNAVGDTNLYRSASNVLKTDGKLVAAGGLGVGNSAAAIVAVGTLARKIEVFDAAGASLGFIPVYASIT